MKRAIISLDWVETEDGLRENLKFLQGLLGAAGLELELSLLHQAPFKLGPDMDPVGDLDKLLKGNNHLTIEVGHFAMETLPNLQPWIDLARKAANKMGVSLRFDGFSKAKVLWLFGPNDSTVRVELPTWVFSTPTTLDRVIAAFQFEGWETEVGEHPLGGMSISV